MARSRRRYNKNRDLGIKNRVRGIIKKAHDLAQCYGVDVDLHIQLENNFAAGYQSIPDLHTQRTTIAKDQLFGPEDFVSQNEKYHQLFSTQLPGRSASVSSTSSTSNIPLLPSALSTKANHTQLAYATTPFTTEEAGEQSPASQLMLSSKSPCEMRVSQATATSSLAHTAPISFQQAKDILDLVHNFF
ncbi:hypothetical protein GGI35DRAFT_459800 [Trichoderma velutinum]